MKPGGGWSNEAATRGLEFRASFAPVLKAYLWGVKKCLGQIFGLKWLFRWSFLPKPCKIKLDSLEQTDDKDDKKRGDKQA